MDKEMEQNLDEVLKKIKEGFPQEGNGTAMDPIAKMMLTAVLHETRKIQDLISSHPNRIADRFCEDFIPRRNLSAMPAITILEPSFKTGAAVTIDGSARFSYKPPTGKPLNYIPIFQNYALPLDRLYWLTSQNFHCSLQGNILPQASHPNEVSKPLTVPTQQENILWIGLKSPSETHCLNGLSLLVKTNGEPLVTPVRISVGDTGRELAFATMNRMEDIRMVEPFDSQQASGTMFAILQEWKEALLNMEDTMLVYLTDPTKDRDLFKAKHFPSVFQFCLLSEELESIQEGTLWLKVEFPDGYHFPDQCQVIVNAFPVANVDVDQVILTAASPIAKLQKQEDAFFLTVLNTSNQSRKEGFDMEEDDFLIRDFDTSCYHDGDLYRDVRNLYHHFVEDYYSFLEYNGIKDGEMINRLRETFNKIGKSVGSLNAKYRFDSGVYALRNINRNPQPSSTKVAFITTRGREGNQPKAGVAMENKKCPGFGKEIRVVVAASCGRDKATADERYEQLRYYTLTQDRLYTKMDIDAFLRKEIMVEFGSEEFKRIFVRINIEGTGGNSSLQRGLYINIEFKDKTNYEKAMAVSFDTQMKQKIENKSCISMSIMVKLINLEK